MGTERIGIVGKRGGGVSGERGRDSGEERRRGGQWGREEEGGSGGERRRG